MYLNTLYFNVHVSLKNALKQTWGKYAYVFWAVELTDEEWEIERKGMPTELTNHLLDAE